jgi:hypothetical protein
MTEREWLACEDTMAMTNYLASGSVRDRKGYLVGCACSRAAWGLLVDNRSRWAVEITERMVDGLSSIEEQRQAWEAACQASEDLEEHCVQGAPPECEQRWSAAGTVDRLVLGPHAFLSNWDYIPQGSGPAILRDIFGNPFRPVAFDAAWRTSTATALARGMYESHDFTAMPILADALQDAGCDSDDILNHCRDPHATHVRGCWVVDLVMGKV